VAAEDLLAEVAEEAEDNNLILFRFTKTQNLAK
jgi:hypothetical protein